MGQGNSNEWKGYQDQLFADKNQRGVWIDGTEEKGATKVLRNLRSKDGLQSFLKDEEKNELDTAWKLFSFSYIIYYIIYSFTTESNHSFNYSSTNSLTLYTNIHKHNISILYVNDNQSLI